MEANLHFKIDWASLIPYFWTEIYCFLCFTLYYRIISKAYIWRGGLTEGFLRYEFGGLIFGIFGGAYFQNFTVFGDRG